MERDEVLIVGAGASGAAVACEARDRRISRHLPGAGRLGRATGRQSSDPEWEIHRVTDESPYPNVRRAPADYPVADSDTPIKPLMYNGVGGSTIKWGAHFPALPPLRFPGPIARRRGR